MIEMNTRVLFSNTPDTSLVSPGGYVVTFKDGTMETMDFKDTEIYQEENENILRFKQYNLDEDYATCTDDEFLKKIRNIKGLYEFFVFCGESPLFIPLKVIDMSFYDTKTGEIYNIAKNIVSSIQPKCE